jgi:hypothetical protein
MRRYAQRIHDAMDTAVTANQQAEETRRRAQVAALGTGRAGGGARWASPTRLLARWLAALVRDGLLIRRQYQGAHRSHDEYLPTETGADLLPVRPALAGWAEAHTEPRRRRSHGHHSHLVWRRDRLRRDILAAAGPSARTRSGGQIMVRSPRRPW